MPLSGRAMLINFMNIDAEHEPDFNRWYDKEHLAERVAIPGFIEARRYVAEDAPQRYLGIYTTETIEVLDSPAYRDRLANQTSWSLTNIGRFRDATRACARVVSSMGVGRGAALGFLRLRPHEGGANRLRAAIAGRVDAALDLDGILSVHLLESDPRLSTPLVETGDAAGAYDWYVLIDATNAGALRAARTALELDVLADQLQPVSTGHYRLLWDLAKAELDA